MMLSLLLISLILFSACGTLPAPPPVEIEPPAQVQPVQPEEPAEAVPDPAELLYQGQASMRVVTDEGKVIYIDPYVGEGYDLPADLILVTHAHLGIILYEGIGNTIRVSLTGDPSEEIRSAKLILKTLGLRKGGV